MPDRVMKEVAAKIRAARERAGLSQDEVATRLGLSGPGYGYFERGQRNVGLHYYLRLPGVLGCSIVDLLPSSLVQPVDRRRFTDPQLAELVDTWLDLSAEERPAFLIAIRAVLSLRNRPNES